MGFGSLWHWIIVLLIVVILFGRNRVSEIMGDFGKGISSFKKGMSEDSDKPAEKPAAQIGANSEAVSEPIDAAKANDKSAS